MNDEGAAKAFLRRKLKEFLASRNSVYTQKSAKPDVDAVTFTNQNKTEGTLSNSQPVNTQASGIPRQTDIGYKQPDGSYLVHKDPLKLVYISSKGGDASLIYESLTLDGFGNSQFFIQKNKTSSLYAVDPTTTGLPAGTITFVGFSSNGKHLALATHIVAGVDSSITTDTIYWCVYKNFTLNSTNNKVESTSIVIGNKVLSYSILPLPTAPGNPDTNPHTGPNVATVGGPIHNHTNVGGGLFAFSQDSSNNPILDYSSVVIDDNSTIQNWIDQFDISSPTISVPAENRNLNLILYSITDLLGSQTFTDLLYNSTVGTWVWHTSSNGGSISDSVPFAGLELEKLFLDPSLTRVAHYKNEETSIRYLSTGSYIGAFDSGHASAPVVFTDTEYIIAGSSPFFNDDFVNAKDSEIFYNYYIDSGKYKVAKYSKGVTITKGDNREVNPPDPAFYQLAPRDWILK